MARPLRIQYPGAFYHVMCRGNKGHNIFLDDDDRKKFLFLLAESLEIYQVILYVYVLMNNHFHLVIQTKRANLGEFMVDSISVTRGGSTIITVHMDTFIKVDTNHYLSIVTNICFNFHATSI